MNESNNPGHDQPPATRSIAGPERRQQAHPMRLAVQGLMLAAAVVLVVVAVRVPPQSADARDDRRDTVTSGLANPIDQRNAMIAELRLINLRLERLEARLGTDPAGD